MPENQDPTEAFYNNLPVQPHDPALPLPPSPVELCLKQVLATAERPCTEANVIALQDHLQTLCKAIEQTKSELPLQLFALLDDSLRRTALVALCQAIIISTLNTLARERADRRIITPGDRRRL